MIAALRLFSLFFFVIIALAGCADEKAVDPLRQVDKPVTQLYNEAFDQFHEENYKKASELFDEVERQHPYSQWATRAELLAAYAEYQGLRYDDAILALDRFIQLHPGHPYVGYAYYLKALCYYEQIGDIRRDQRTTTAALDGFDDVIKRFPDTPYARDSRLKIDLARDRLAAKDMDIGRYYEGQGMYIAAINRFRDVTTQYQTTSHTPEALLRLVECYKALGIDDEAKKTAAVLGYNYPDSPWYKDSYALVSHTGYEAPGDATRPTMLDQAWDSMF